MKVLSVDPGPEKGGVLVLEWPSKTVLFSGDIAMDKLALVLLGKYPFNSLAQGVCSTKNELYINEIDIFTIENITCMGMVVGRTTFDTAEMIGDLRRCWWVGTNGRKPSIKIARLEVKTHICGGSSYQDPTTGRRRAVTDTTVKYAIQERYPQTGGGKCPAIGTKKEPGPLYCMKGYKHAWSALAIALTHMEKIPSSTS